MKQVGTQQSSSRRTQNAASVATEALTEEACAFVVSFRLRGTQLCHGPRRGGCPVPARELHPASVSRSSQAFRDHLRRGECRHQPAVRMLSTGQHGTFERGWESSSEGFVSDRSPAGHLIVPAAGGWAARPTATRTMPCCKPKKQDRCGVDLSVIESFAELIWHALEMSKQGRVWGCHWELCLTGPTVSNPSCSSDRLCLDVL